MPLDARRNSQRKRVLPYKEVGGAEVTTNYVRDNFSEVMSNVSYGSKKYYVTRHGKRLAAIVPLSVATLYEELKEKIAACKEEGGSVELEEFEKILESVKNE